ncbi:MAG: heme exporter protein CcmD [Anaerolineae bacterium]|nr:heme exporter protein CcmD [Anaerolineae bacterium]
MPETTSYMILGYAITLIVLFALIGYLVLKARNLRAELKTLEALEAEDQAESKVPAAPTTTSATAIKS